MKRVIALVSVLMLCLAAASWASDIPNLVGKWTGDVEIHWKDRGFVTGNGSGVFEVLEQKGRMFHGTKSWTNHKGEKNSETFSGIIRADNKSFIIAEHEDGYLLGDILSDSEIMMYYVENGAQPKAMLYEFKRQ